MAGSSKEARERAELRFKWRAQAEKDQARAMDEYVAEGEKRRAKTAKLKALRLAKEAEERAAAAAKPKKKPARRSAKASPKK